MAVKLDRDGARRVELEYEVPGTPEDVWRAIATGEGISSWFTPATVEERAGGRMTFRFGGGVESAATITGWEPHRRFAYEERDWAAHAPPLATEFIIEANAGGTCTLRLVHSLFAEASDWDDQLESFEGGWPVFFEVLRLSLKRFRGLSSAAIRIMQPVSGTRQALWRAMVASLGLDEIRVGARVDTRGALPPPASGVVTLARADQHDAVVLLDAPVEGAAVFGVYEWGGAIMGSASIFLFGDRAAAQVSRDEPAWQTWIDSLSSVAAEAPSVDPARP